MPVFVVLLRAVNVGGTGKLPMSDLKRCASRPDSGTCAPISPAAMSWPSGTASEAEAKAALEAALGAYAGKPVGVIVRTPPRWPRSSPTNPFPDRAANRTVAIFLDARARPRRA